MRVYINFEQVSYRWPRGGQVLKEINLSIKKNETIALMGANGSGKTSLSKLILGLLKPAQGCVLLAGRPIESYSLAERGRQLGYVFQNPERQFFASSVAEEIGFALKYRGLSSEEIQERVAEMLALFELEEYAAAFPLNLSRGEKQRLALAAILASRPDFIIMDEPFTGLDWLRKQRLQTILERVGNAGVGYLIISHDQALCARLCSRMLTLEGGRLL